MNKKDLFGLSLEIEAASLMVTALSNQLGTDEGDTLTPEGFKSYLFGLYHYLDRISNDLTEIDARYDLTERKVSA